MSVSLSRILVATDFSPSANRALKYADVLADSFQGELHVLNVVLEPMPTHATTEDSLPRLIDRARQELAKNILAAGLKYGGEPIQAVRAGYALEEILQYVVNNHIDLIVVGTQGHRGLSRMLLGSVAEKLVRLAKCPVLTVHADQPLTH